jgi:energy-coupling factor transporter ATPase
LGIGEGKVIEVRDLQYSYKLRNEGHLRALKGISLRISPGESVAIIGSNGSGKSTLARCLNGLLVPQSGVVSVDGLDVRQPANWEKIRRRVGMVFQNPDNQIVSTTVEREIAFGLENLAVPVEQLRARTEEVLGQFHLTDLRHRPPHLLSGGEKQRLSMAAVLAMWPKYLILDEPTSLLDPMGRREVRELLQRFCVQGEVTVVHITQFPEEAAEAQRVLVLHRGEVVMEGPPREVFARRERLAQLGLRAPFPVELAGRLSEAGIFLAHPVAEVDDLVAGILALPRSASRSGKEGGGQEQRAIPEKGGERIRVEDLSYRYNPGLPTERLALREVNLSLSRGELVGLVGPIGSGKSTLVQHLNALLRPTSGRVLMDGQDVSRKDLDFQFPERQLFEETVYDDVAFGPRNLNLPQEQMDQRVREALQLVGLAAEEFSPRSPFDLSGGEQRRVAIAGVLALGPEIVIMDEPFVGLDPGGCEQIEEILRGLRRKGATVVLITHNMDLVVSLADRVVVMEEGTVVEDDLPAAVFSSPERVARLGIDLPQATQLMARLREGGWDGEAPVLTMEQAVEAILGRLRAGSAA